MKIWILLLIFLFFCFLLPSSSFFVHSGKTVAVICLLPHWSQCTKQSSEKHYAFTIVITVQTILNCIVSYQALGGEVHEWMNPLKHIPRLWLSFPTDRPSFYLQKCKTIIAGLGRRSRKFPHLVGIEWDQTETELKLYYSQVFYRSACHLLPFTETQSN